MEFLLLRHGCLSCKTSLAVRSQERHLHIFSCYMYSIEFHWVEYALNGFRKRLSDWWVIVRSANTNELTIGTEKDDFLFEASWLTLMCLLPLLDREWKDTILREQLTLYLLAQEVEQNLLGPLWCRFSVRRPHCSQCPTDESSKNTSLRASSLLEGLSAEDKLIKNYSTWNFSWDSTE